MENLRYLGRVCVPVEISNTFRVSEFSPSGCSCREEPIKTEKTMPLAELYIAGSHAHLSWKLDSNFRCVMRSMFVTYLMVKSERSTR